MGKQAVYLFGGDHPDDAIMKGLEDADCSVVQARSISDMLAALQQTSNSVLIVAEVQAGAIALLSLLKEQRSTLPATILYDKEAGDVHTAIKALQLGVREYLLSSDSEAHRELSARLMAERINSQSRPPAPPSRPETARPATALGSGAGGAPSFAPNGAQPNPAADNEFRWDATTHLIQIGADYVRLSPIEGRIFDLLLTNRNHVVSMGELIEHALLKPGVEEREGAKLLRPHLVRLRGKLERQPNLAHRIVNMRGSGYMMI